MMSREARSSAGWFYRQAGETCGPVSTARLKELLAAGRLQARQAVWTKDRQSLRFVPAATAAFGAAGADSQPASA
jgi:hypothetical protein